MSYLCFCLHFFVGFRYCDQDLQEETSWAYKPTLVPNTPIKESQSLISTYPFDLTRHITIGRRIKLDINYRQRSLPHSLLHTLQGNQASTT